MNAMSTVSQPVARPPVIRPGRPSVRTTFQLAADISRARSTSLDELESDIRSSICDWLQGKYPEQLPESARGGESFESDVHGQRLECVGISEMGSWSVRLIQPDAPFRGQAAVPGRTWTTEMAIARKENCIRFGIRVQCASLRYADEPITLTRPRIVVDLSNRFTLYSAGVIGPNAWRPESEEDLARLYDLLTDPTREMPVYMLTVPDRKRLGMMTNEFLLNHVQLARDVQGLAYVVTMPWDVCYQWTERVGKPWSAFLGAVRTYRPGLDFEVDAPTDHPRILADRILAFQYGDFTMERAFEQFLVDKAFEHAAGRRVAWDPCLFYIEARRKRAELASAAVTEDGELRALYEDQIASLNAMIEQLEQEREEALDLATATEKERDQTREENRKLRSRIDVLSRGFSEPGESIADLIDSAPTSYDEMADWVDATLAGSLVLHPRAINRSLKSAEFENVKLVYEVLLLLATEYRQMRMGDPAAREAFHSQLSELNLRCDGSITRERAGEQGDTYFVRYPFQSSGNVFLESHIRTKGNTRDPKRCLAVYFFWDDDTQQVIVGWLPGHLSNRMT